MDNIPTKIYLQTKDEDGKTPDGYDTFEERVMVALEETIRNLATAWWAWRVRKLRRDVEDISSRFPHKHS